MDKKIVCMIIAQLYFKLNEGEGPVYGEINYEKLFQAQRIDASRQMLVYNN